MSEILLTLQEASDFEEKSWNAINKGIQRGKIPAQKINTNTKCGFEYRISLSDLSPAAQQRYYAQHQNQELDMPQPKSINKTLKYDELSVYQRQDVQYWEELLNAWQEYISREPKKRTELTKAFVSEWNAAHERQISVRTIYDKDKLRRQYGSVALADGRLAHKKTGRRIDDDLWAMFLQWYLDENRLSVGFLYTTLKEYIENEGWDVELPSEATFRRAAAEIPKPVIQFFRYGDKAFDDRCAPYVIRIYNFASNDFWSSDYHTLDIMVRDDITDEVYRPHLVVWYDIRSRKILSMRLRKSSDSDGVILAFRDAATLYGIPNNVYLDNGREYLVSDFGGRGRRKTDEKAKYPTPMLERLGIEMVNARVANGKAKVVERTFKQVSSEFSKLFLTYCGNRPATRPERHNDVIQNLDNIPYASEVKRDLWDYICGWYNKSASEAVGLNGRTPDETYAACLIQKRVFSESQANIMLLRSTRLQSVDRNGVFVTIGQRKLWFFEAEFVSQYMGAKVYVRFDPDAMGSVRVYDEHEKFMTVLDRLPEGGYNGEDDTEAIKKVSAGKRRMERLVKEFVENQKDIMEAPDLRDAVMSVARSRIEQDEQEYNAAILNLNFTVEKEEKDDYLKAAGETVDFSKMINNALKMRGED